MEGVEIGSDEGIGFVKEHESVALGTGPHRSKKRILSEGKLWTRKLRRFRVR